MDNNDNKDVKIDEGIDEEMDNNHKNKNSKADEILGKIKQGIEIGKDKFEQSGIKEKVKDNLHEVQSKCKDIDTEKIRTVGKEVIDELNNQIINIRNKAKESVNKKYEEQLDKDDHSNDKVSKMVCLKVKLPDENYFSKDELDDLYNKLLLDSNHSLFMDFVDKHNMKMAELIDSIIIKSMKCKKDIMDLVDDYSNDNKSIGFYIKGYQPLKFKNCITYVSKTRNALINVVTTKDSRIYFTDYNASLIYNIDEKDGIQMLRHSVTDDIIYKYKGIPCNSELYKFVGDNNEFKIVHMHIMLLSDESGNSDFSEFMDKISFVLNDINAHISNTCKNIFEFDMNSKTDFFEKYSKIANNK